ncbi:hypothetical protein CSKR_108720 [Clonorchis sinensis]|uniref:Uncharacterized protein n=1 Tax=Clonorchis sinensis TaxID=79923 RepID=A0A419PK25_CLOSI|nr:hypothetical protein CSKR_108720 [Clonorchis sinensis]
MEPKNTRPVTSGSKVASSFSIRQLLCLSEPPFDCERPTNLYCSKKQPIGNDSLTRENEVLDEPPPEPVSEHKSSSCCPPELLSRKRSFIQQQQQQQQQRHQEHSEKDYLLPSRPFMHHLWRFSELFGTDDACLENYNSKRNLMPATTFVPLQSGDSLVKTSRQLSSHKTSSGLDAIRCNSNILTGTVQESDADDLPPFFLHNNASTYASIPIFPRETSGKQYRRRKARTVFSDHQLLGLEHRFESQHYLSTPERIELANRLSLSETQVKTWFQNRRMKHKKMKRSYVSSGQDTQQSLPLSGKRDGNPNYPGTCGTNSSCSGTEDLEYERTRKVENFLCLPPSPTLSASASETYVNLEAVQSETWRAKRQVVIDALCNPPPKKESKSLVVSSEADVSIPVKCRISEYESAQSGKDLMTSCGVTRDVSDFDDLKSSVFNPKFLMQHYFLNCATQ